MRSDLDVVTFWAGYWSLIEDKLPHTHSLILQGPSLIASSEEGH